MPEDTNSSNTSTPPNWRVEGATPPPPLPPNGTAPKKKRVIPDSRSPFWRVLIIGLVINWILASVLLPGPNRVTVPYTLFKDEVRAGNVVEVTSRNDTIQGKFAKPVTYPKGGTKRADRFETERPAFAENDGLLELLVEKSVVVNATSPDKPPSLIEKILYGFGPVLLILALYLFAFRRMSSGGLGRLGGLGKSKAVRYDATVGTRTTFADVAGIDEAENELVEIVDFLKNPDKYRRLGAKIPKGVLLAGPPGTGKTLLAKAVAGEANVPFFSMSASEFEEMFVGLGASRVRDLFGQAKAAAPAIIFIDEIDAIGRARSGANFGGGGDAREQTLNQILTEMDGFTGSEGVIVVAATNRKDVLDHALLRPGRFDRHVIVNAPDQVGRLEILKIHSRDVPLGPDVDLSGMASTTPGMVGADLRNLVNEAALLAARLDHEAVTQADFGNALEKIVLGAERKITLTEDERRRTAFHESGHAILGILRVGADPVRKVSIIPRGGALGVTFQSPSTDRYGYDAAYLQGRIIMALGGRAAEELVFGNVTTGAESDLETCTNIARSMVGRWGMSDAIGPVSILPGPGHESPFGVASQVSADTLKLVDEEVRRIIEESYADALSTLAANRGKLDALAAALLEHETLDEVDVYKVVGLDRPSAIAARELAIPVGSAPMHEIEAASAVPTEA